MSKVLSSLACGAVLCAASVAMGTPRDWISFTSQVSNGGNGSALNQVSQATITPTYQVRRLRVYGSLVSGGVNSYASEARILVTPPSGSPFTIQPFSIPGAFGTAATPQSGWVYDLPSAIPSCHGTWTFRFYESFDDAGVDATWSNISFQLDDGVGSAPMEVTMDSQEAVAGLRPTLITAYIAPATNPLSTGLAVNAYLQAIGAGAQSMYDDGTHGDQVAGDHIFSLLASVPYDHESGGFLCEYYTGDDQNRHAQGTFNVWVQSVEDTGELFNGFDHHEFVHLGLDEVHWYRVVIPAVGVSQGWLDVWSQAPAAGDTQIGLYNASGQLMGSDDDDGSGYLSALSFGQPTPIRNWCPTGVPFDGRDGALPAGTYYLAVGAYPMTFANNWTVTGNGGWIDDIDLGFALTYRTNPTVTGHDAFGSPLETVLITGYAGVGRDPDSTGMVMAADLSALGGSIALMYDDGTHGDQFAGDHTFTLPYTIPAAMAEGAYSVTLQVQDSIGRVGTGTASVNVDRVGDYPATARTVNAPGDVTSIIGFITAGDVDMFKIHICDPAHFSALVTVGNFDTELFLFRQDGRGVAFNDDSPQGGNRSSLTGPLVTSIAPGDYYLAMTGFDTQPVDGLGRRLFATYSNQPTPPDGPGGAYPMMAWDRTSYGFTSGAFTITLTGVTGQRCTCGSADFDCDGDVGTDADIESFFACIAGNCPADPCDNNADFDGDGDMGTDADIEAFFRVMGGGPC